MELFGTWRGGRTLILVKEPDFESGASANSAIQAKTELCSKKTKKSTSFLYKNLLKYFIT